VSWQTEISAGKLFNWGSVVGSPLGGLLFRGDIGYINRTFVRLGMLPSFADQKTKEIADKIVLLMQQGIIARKFNLPPNAPRTIAAKGSDTPLFDTGAMVYAITTKKVGETESMCAYFVGIPNGPAMAAAGPATYNFDEGVWFAFHEHKTIVQIAYLGVHGFRTKIPPFGRRIQVPKRDFVKPALDEARQVYKAEMRRFVWHYLRNTRTKVPV
jgi:hypothetical protein